MLRLWWCLICAAPVLTGAASARAEVIGVKVDRLTFSPAQVSAHVGDTIEWVNADFVAHTATARNKDWDVMLGPGKTGRLVVKKAGTVDYYCRFHPNMTGQITVTDDEVKRP
ncbi:cupredoxin domain-containing protein [Microvirga sp. 2TAF3]|uniref:cupredoxin domain-containing protein n=1 Tax=Microvirga sp. 2TAF3 TaxID=3233014 RepID=UPI003F96A8B1